MLTFLKPCHSGRLYTLLYSMLTYHANISLHMVVYTLHVITSLPPYISKLSVLVRGLAGCRSLFVSSPPAVSLILITVKVLIFAFLSGHGFSQGPVTYRPSLFPVAAIITLLCDL